jgi:hypothetical protein
LNAAAGGGLVRSPLSGPANDTPHGRISITRMTTDRHEIFI